MDWTEKLSIGIPEIDEQHKTLIDCVNRLDEAGADESRNLAVYFVLDRMEDYARVHFAVEEIVMRIVRYPGIDAHIRAHRSFMAEVQRLKRDELANDAHLKIQLFLGNWWRDHILILDHQYADYFLMLPGRSS